MDIKKEIATLESWLENIKIEEKKSDDRKRIGFGVSVCSDTISKLKGYAVKHNIGIGVIVESIIDKWIEEKEKTEGPWEKVDPHKRISHAIGRRSLDPMYKLFTLKRRIQKELDVIKERMEQ